MGRAELASGCARLVEWLLFRHRALRSSDPSVPLRCTRDHVLCAPRYNPLCPWYGAERGSWGIAGLRRDVAAPRGGTTSPASVGRRGSPSSQVGCRPTARNGYAYKAHTNARKIIVRMPRLPSQAQLAGPLYALQSSSRLRPLGGLLHSSCSALSVHSAVGHGFPCGCQACTSSLWEVANDHQRPQRQPTRGYQPGASSKGDASSPERALLPVVHAVSVRGRSHRGSVASFRSRDLVSRVGISSPRRSASGWARFATSRGRASHGSVYPVTA